MFKSVLATGTVLLLLTLCLAPAGAQTGYIAAYFDEAHSQETAICPGMGIPGFLYVAAVNFNVFITGAQFQIAYPDGFISWLADMDTPPVTAGNTVEGIAMGFALPQNGFFPVRLCRVAFIWGCDGCVFSNIPVIVRPHPLLGPVGVTDFPDFKFIPGVGLTSMICATIPTEETTWGAVKALYSE